jgi:hypothetical protein
MTPKEMLDNLAIEFNKPLQDLKTSICEHYAVKILEITNVIPPEGFHSKETILNDALRTVCSLIAQVHEKK